jgi:hypothetical protein
VGIRDYLRGLNFKASLDQLRKAAFAKAAEEFEEEVWDPFFMAWAKGAYDSEKAWKENKDPRFSNGALRMSYAKEQARKAFPDQPGIQDDLAFELVWSFIEPRLSEVIKGLNQATNGDWVGYIESIEHQIARPVETLIQRDLDDDGKIGDVDLKHFSPPAGGGPLAFLLAAGLLLVSAGPAPAVGKYQRYEPGGTWEVPAPPASPAPVAGGTKYRRYEKALSSSSEPEAPAPGWKMPPLPGLTAGVWSGSVGKGVQAGGKWGDWALVGQVDFENPKPSPGLGLQWSRIGGNVLYDRTDRNWKAGIYWNALAAQW